mmetsp:Transcript_6389/g.14067  ORF Transcript_6389/g.14067 Transcript_6389/m.14067 type:complete len:216 (-) Transcript_6389:247-894(-)
MRIIFHQPNISRSNLFKSQIRCMQKSGSHFKHRRLFRRSKSHNFHGIFQIPKGLLIRNAIATIIRVRSKKVKILIIIIQKTNFLHYGTALILFLDLIIVVITVLHGEHFVKYVIIPLPRRLVHQPNLFQQVRLDRCPHQRRAGDLPGRQGHASPLREEFHFDILPKPGGVVVTDGTGIAERFHDGIGLEDSSFDGHVVLSISVLVGLGQFGKVRH